MSKVDSLWREYNAIPKIKSRRVTLVKLTGPPKYYHDLSDVIKKYRLHPLGFRCNSNIINSK